jgi:hypothetical protein
MTRREAMEGHMRSWSLLGVIGLALTASGAAGAHTLVVDGDPADWLARTPKDFNTGFVARTASDGEYVWRDALDDERTDLSSPHDAELDILSFRVAATRQGTVDGLALFVETAAQPTQTAQVQVAIDTDQVVGLGENWFAGFADTRVSDAAHWEYLVQTTFNECGLSLCTARVYEPAFTYTPSATAARGLRGFEIFVPWTVLGLSGPPTRPLRFVVATFRSRTPSASSDDPNWTVDIGDASVSNAVDVVSDYGNPCTGTAPCAAPSTPPNTWAEVSDQVVNYFPDVYLRGGAGSVTEVYAPLLVNRFVYVSGSSAGEWVVLQNRTAALLSLASYKLGDEETPDGTESMRQFPAGASIAAGGTYVVAFSGAAYFTAFGERPDAEFSATDTLVPDMPAFPAWASGGWNLAAADEILVLDQANTIVDLVTYGASGYAAPAGPTPITILTTDIVYGRQPETQDTDNCNVDFANRGAPCADDTGCASPAVPCIGCYLNTCNQTKPAGTPCLDADLCDGAEACDAAGVCAAGTPLVCDDANPCTLNLCAPATGCDYSTAEPATTTCNDGDACTTGDHCSGSGTCIGTVVACTTPPNVACWSTAGTCSGGSCSYTPLGSSTTCNDGDPCTTGDHCNGSGTCIGTAVVCTTPPNVACWSTAGLCSGGACFYTPLSGSTTCDDGDACTSSDHCNGAGTCTGTAMVCSTPPNTACYAATGTCSGGSCSYAPLGSSTACDDANPCTVSDHCDGAGACAGAAMTCSTPPSPTCVDATHSRTWAAPGTCSSGTCVYADTTTVCTFGCNAASGLCTGDPCTGVTCTTPPDPACWAATGTCSGGTCSYTPLGSGTACDDAEPCTVGDACDGSGACAGTAMVCDTPPPPECADAGTSRSFAAVGTCGAGTCGYAPTLTACARGCDDATGLCSGDPCATVVCDTPPSADCYPAVGTCSEGTCDYPPLASGTTCDDGEPCTVSDECDGAGACAGIAMTCAEPPPPECIDAGTSRAYEAAGTCTAGTCSYTATDTDCPAGCDSMWGLCNGDPCAGVTCEEPPNLQCWVPAGACVDGTCEYTMLPTGTSCDDGEPCTLDDACDAAGTCLPGEPDPGCSADADADGDGDADADADDGAADVRPDARPDVTGDAGPDGEADGATEPPTEGGGCGCAVISAARTSADARLWLGLALALGGLFGLRRRARRPE